MTWYEKIHNQLTDEDSSLAGFFKLLFFIILIMWHLFWFLAIIPSLADLPRH